jgi:hypothetical protein
MIKKRPGGAIKFPGAKEPEKQPGAGRPDAPQTPLEPNPNRGKSPGLPPIGKPKSGPDATPEPGPKAPNPWEKPAQPKMVKTPLKRDDLDDHLAKVDILKRSGNYILSVGLPKSGKTTLQSFMTFYMDVAGQLHADLDNAEKNGEINTEAQRLRTQWLESWKKGNFPNSTPVGEDEIREVRLNVVNQENTRQTFNLSFLEISGENFTEVVPTDHQVPKLFKRLKEFLSNKKIKLNIVFVLKTEEVEGDPSNDALFQNFISFINNQLNLDIKNRVGLLILLPNPKEVLGEEDWERSRRDRKFLRKTVRDYVYKKCPATYKIYDGWSKKNRGLMPFHIGDLGPDSDKLETTDYADVQGFIKGNYQLFTGRRLQPNIWRRFQKLIKS